MLLVVEPVPNTTALRVLAGGETTLGFLRQAEDGRWVARSLGAADGSTAGTIRRFLRDERHLALQWLAEREPVPSRVTA